MNSTTNIPLSGEGWPHCFTCVPFYHSQRGELFQGIPDRYTALFLPIIVYWLFCAFFHFLDISGWKWLEKYKIHESEEVKSRNLVSMSHVVWVIIGQQVIQSVIGFLWMPEERRALGHVESMRDIGEFLQPLLTGVSSKWSPNILPRLTYSIYWWFIPAAQFISAMLIFDTWQYVTHRLMHTNRFLYRHIHSWHHRLYVPYAFGALYNHPIEGCIIDTFGLGLADSLTRMTTRQLTALFILLTMKNVDHHCGYSFPFDPFQMITTNNADFHDIHHQTFGMKFNFSQSFFLHWDVMLGTHLNRQDVEKLRQQRKSRSR